MGVISFFRRRKRGSELDLPWNEGTAIFTHIQQHLSTGSQTITYTGSFLPDEQQKEDQHRETLDFNWTAGAHDSVTQLHSSDKSQKTIVKNILDLLNNISQSDSQHAKVELYRMLKKCGVIGFVDDIAEQLVDSSIEPTLNLHRFLRFLAQRSPDREPVKFAIALLGLIGDDRDIELIKTLSHHEEFTLYGAAAINNRLEDADYELWQLACSVHGWGRIHLVERLAETSNPEIRDWLLREGFRNDIMHEYLAYTVTVSGDLNHALSHGFVDDQLLQSASEIIEALVSGGPSEDINDYEYAATTIESYLRHLRTRHKNLKSNYFITVQYIHQYLTEDIEESVREANGWTAEIIERSLQLCDEILKDLQWPDLAKELLKSKDEEEFMRANEIASWLGINTWDTHWQRLQEDPVNSGRWLELMRITPWQEINKVLTYAEKTLPLDDIAKNPADETGIGPEYEAHHCLDFILQELERFPHYGWTLIRAGLHSPVVRNRMMGLNALKLWDTEEFNTKIINTLKDLQLTELEPDLTQDIAEILDQFS